MPFLVVAGVLWGTGGLFGSLLAERTGLSAARRRRVPARGRRRPVAGPAGRCPAAAAAVGAAWRRIAAIGALAALFQAGYFTAVSLTSVSLATLVTIGSAPVIVLLVDRAGGGRWPATVGLAVLGTRPAGRAAR